MKSKSLCRLQHHIALCLADFHSLRSATPVQIGAKVTLRTRASHRSHNLTTNHKTADILTRSFFHKVLNEKIRFQPAKRINNRLGRLLGFRQDNALALRALQKFHNQRRGPHKPDNRVGVLRTRGKSRVRHPNLMSRHKLMRMKLIAACRNPL